jgi:hypothetical protein
MPTWAKCLHLSQIPASEPHPVIINLDTVSYMSGGSLGETPVTYIAFLGQREGDTRFVVMGTPEEILAAWKST